MKIELGCKSDLKVRIQISRYFPGHYFDVFVQLRRDAFRVPFVLDEAKFYSSSSWSFSVAKLVPVGPRMSEPLSTADVNYSDFVASVRVLVDKPHVLNKRLVGSVTLR